jgi:hypothetical protein
METERDVGERLTFVKGRIKDERTRGNRNVSL